jgi:hypothetical protein
MIRLADTNDNLKDVLEHIPELRKGLVARLSRNRSNEESARLLDQLEMTVTNEDLAYINLSPPTDAPLWLQATLTRNPPVQAAVVWLRSLASQHIMRAIAHVAQESRADQSKVRAPGAP